MAMATSELLALMEKSFKELRENTIVRGTMLDIKPGESRQRI